MLLKSADSKESSIQELERLLASAPSDRKTVIERELFAMRAGIKGEKEAAYLIDFGFKASENYIIIHDLRLEIQGRVAQIDHLLINRNLYCFVLETKHFNSGLKITEEGEFLRWNSYKKTFEGMPSPLAQNDRHIAVLRDAFSEVNMPSRLGVRLTPTFHSYVLVSPGARIDRPSGFDTSRVIKADAFDATLDKKFEKAGVLEVFGGLAKTIDTGTLVAIGRQLVAMHRPHVPDVAAKFGMPVAKSEPSQELTTPPTAQPKTAHGPQCRHCESPSGTILYGKYGYYFKCTSCDGNTPVRVDCGHDGHKERIRKAGLEFFRECTACKSSTLYFTNPPNAP